MESESRVLRRFKRAQEEALEELADHVADEFLQELSGLGIFSEDRVSTALTVKGLTADSLNSISEGKTAGPVIKALGGLVLRGVWYALSHPFVILGKLISSGKFRAEIKGAFKKALHRDLRATRHLGSVASRWANGEAIHPEEFKAAKQHLLRILIKIVLIYFAGPGVAGVFSGGIWKAVSAIGFSAEEIILLLLERPLSAAMKKLMSGPTAA
jgi:hypothetical protein